MKNMIRVLSVLMALVLCMGILAACGGTASEPAATTKATVAAEPTTEATEASTPFVAPPDALGLVISADSQLVTWQPYATDSDTIDFKSVNVKDLGMAGEMSLYYMEPEVTYYDLTGEKLEEIEVYEIVSGCVIGITTLEEGVQEVYVLSFPAEEVEEVEDPLEELVEETIPSETTEPTVSDDVDPDEVDG